MLATSFVLLTPARSGAARHPAFHMPDLVGRSRLAVYRTMRHDGLYFVTTGPGSANDHWKMRSRQSPEARRHGGLAQSGDAECSPGAVAHAARVVPR